MSGFFKVLYLAVHVVLSVLLVLLVVGGFWMAGHRDGSSTNPGGLLTGILVLLGSGVLVVPLVVAVATRWVSRWWLLAHAVVGGASLVLTVYAALYEQPGSSDLG